MAERHKDISADRREQIIEHVKSLPSDQLPEVVRTFERNGAPPAEIALVRELTGAPRPPMPLRRSARAKGKNAKA